MPFRTRSVVFSIALLASLALCQRTFAQSGTHGEGHAENHDWYRELKQPGTNMSCCNGTLNGIEGDCRPTRAYIDDNGTWRALIDGMRRDGSMRRIFEKYFKPELAAAMVNF